MIKVLCYNFRVEMLQLDKLLIAYLIIIEPLYSYKTRFHNVIISIITNQYYIKCIYYFNTFFLEIIKYVYSIKWVKLFKRAIKRKGVFY